MSFRVVGSLAGWCGVVLCLAASSLVAAPTVGAVAGFGDVAEGRYYTEPVQWSVDNDVAGIDGNCFGPDAPVSRGEAAVYIWNMQGQPAAPAHSFVDVTDESQDAAVSWMSHNEITTGTSPTTFDPDTALTRAHLVTFLWRLDGKPSAPAHPFVDVHASWQQGSVSWAADREITTGTSPTTFDPDDTLTRAHLVTFLYRYQGEPEVMVDPASPECDPDAEPVAPPPVVVPVDGSAVTVPAGPGFVADLGSVTVEGAPGVFSEATEVRVAYSEVGVGEHTRLTTTAAQPVLLDFGGVEPEAPLTVRFSTGRAGLKAEHVTPAVWDADIGAWVPTIGDEVTVRDGEIIVKTAAVGSAAGAAVNGFDLGGVTVAAEGFGSAPVEVLGFLPIPCDWPGASLVSWRCGVAKVVTVFVPAVWGTAEDAARGLLEGVVDVAGLSADAVVRTAREYVPKVMRAIETGIKAGLEAGIAFFAEWLLPNLAKFFGLRADPPQCFGATPDWARDGIDFSETGEPHPRVHLCTETGSGEDLHVKTVNNRNFGFQVTSNDVPLKNFTAQEPADVNVGSLLTNKANRFLVDNVEALGGYQWRLSEASFDIAAFERSDRTDSTTQWKITGHTAMLDTILMGGDLLGRAADHVPFAAIALDAAECATPVTGVVEQPSHWTAILDTTGSCLSTAATAVGATGVGLPVAVALETVAQAMESIVTVDTTIKHRLTQAEFLLELIKQPPTLTIQPTVTVGGAHESEPETTLPRGYGFKSVTAGDKHTCALYGQGDSSIICWGDDSDGKLNAPDGEFTALAAGYDHTCALRADRTIACWGADDSEQATPPRQSGGWRRGQFAAGFKHSCARRGSDLICWGSGGASRRYESLPFTFRGLSGGDEHYCGLNDDNAIECIGDNSFGQLDAPDGAYRSIAAGARHTCASYPSRGNAVCWGDNTHGQTDIPQASAGGHGFVAAGNAHSCATPRVTGPIVCWGSNAQGQLRAPTDASGSYRAIAAGSRHTCSIRSGAHEIVCWGDNEHGQTDAPALPRPATDEENGEDGPGDGPILTAEFASLVQGSTPATPQVPEWSEFSPEIDAPGGPFVQVTTGAGVCGLREDHSLDCWWDNGDLITNLPSGSFSSFEASGPYGCAIRRLDASLACWGSDELSDNSPTGAFSKVSVSEYGRVACAIRASGRLECWDGNPFGRVSAVVDPANQGGSGDYSDSAAYADVSVSGSTACAVRTDGTLDCWGSLLWGGRLPQSHPQDVRAVSVGGERGVCALKQDGSIACMTNNSSNTLQAPQWQEAPAGNYRSLSVGTGYACAVTTAGAARCWLLDGNPQYSSYPTRTHGRHPESFAPPSGVFQTIRASRTSSRARTCGVRNDGSITCWGTRSSTPVEIDDPSVDALASGSDFTCGLRRDTTISCWGANWFGQSDAPSGSFTSVAAGSWHACAIRTDRTLACWGYNQHGQTDAPSGMFTQVVAAGFYSCGLRTDASVTCWGSNYSHALDAPDGSFSKIAISRGGGGRVSDLGTTCGLRTNGQVTCWGGTRTAGTVSGIGAELARASAATPFKDFDISPGYWCAVRTDGIVICAGFSCGSAFFSPAPRHHCYTDPTNRKVFCESPADDPFARLLITRFGACASTNDGRWTCFGEGVHEYWPPGARDVSPPGHIGCARRPDGTWTCNGTLGPTVWDPFGPETVTFS